ncbi:MAG: class II fructose-1,6-bisphosphate aldolase [Bacillota bacterium]
MPLVNMTEMLNKALEEDYAVGQFNINNLEWTQAILEACEEENSPVILGVSEGATSYMGGYNTVMNIVNGLLEDMEITIPVAVHLDHGSSFEACKQAIDAGYTSVMIDASSEPFEDNVSVTKKVVDYAKKHNVSVEAELGSIGGSEEDRTDDIKYADPQECKELVEKTDIDALAPALGSVHGPYQGEPDLGFEEMEEITAATGLPLVLHGGTGIPTKDIKKAINRGTSKINVNTNFQQAWTEIVRKVLAEDEEVYDPRKIIGPGKKGIVETAKRKIEVFGSANKA